MSIAQVCHVLERCIVSTPLREGVTSWLESMAMEHRWQPLALQGVCFQERQDLTQQLHEAAQRLFSVEKRLRTSSARSFQQDWQTYGERVIQDYLDQTLYLEDFSELDAMERIALLNMLGQAEAVQKGDMLLLLDWPEQPNELESKWLQVQGGHTLSLLPLYQRGTDIDHLICQLSSRIVKERQWSDLEGFSLEAIAHIHRAVLQTSRESHDLYDFLCTALERAAEDRLPLQEGYIVAWPTVRLLEDKWQYRSLTPPSLHEELQQYNFQERLFSASLEQASCRSGFSQELIEQECELLQRMIDELPSHQRNYQGLTARLDQLLWMSMKLISNARTQAELRDFFGFGGKGKIPKATAKLKFDQYHLEHYGFRSSDPQPWAQSQELEALSSVSKPPIMQQENPQPRIEVASSRDILEIDGELPETLFWRHQDLFTVLGADPLTEKQIASLMGVDRKRVKKDLKQLTGLGMLEKQGQQYHLPSDDLYYMHTHSPLRFLEDNLLRSLHSSMAESENSLLDNLFLRLPEEGLPLLREELIRPFLHQQLLPIADQESPSTDESYDKSMYTLLLIGTHRLSPQVHGRLPMDKRVLYYFREASLQRADLQQRQQAICLQASLMMSPSQAPQALSQVQSLRKNLRKHLPQGRGNKPNFNITLCFTRMPLAFYRDLTSSPQIDETLDL